MLSPATVALRPDNMLYPAKHSQPTAFLLSLNGRELTERSQSTVLKELNFSQPPPTSPTHTQMGCADPRAPQLQSEGQERPGHRAWQSQRVLSRQEQGQHSLLKSTNRTTHRLTPRPPDPGSQSGGACGGELEECKSGLLLLGKDGLGFPEGVSLHQEQPPASPG